MTAPRARMNGNATDVLEPPRLLECVQIARQAVFQSLVRRFISQILYGCTSSYCTTPTCFSCTKRLVSRPFRPPTQLTARALAFYLASQDNPRSRLCSNELNIDPDTLEIEGADGLYILSEEGSREPTCHVYPRPPLLPHGPNDDMAYTNTGSSWIRDAAERERIASAIDHRHPPRKDPKSLAQNLYDSATMIFAYSKRIPSPFSVFSLLAKSSIQEPNPVGNPPSHVSLAAADDKRQHDSSQSPFTAPSSADATPVPMNDRLSSEPTPPQSFQPPGTRASGTNAANITSQVLSNGQRLHKIWHVPGGHAGGMRSIKLSDSSSLPGTLDGTLDNTITEKVKMRATHSPAIMPRKPIPSTLLPNPSDNKDSGFDQGPRHGQLSPMPVYSHLSCDIMELLKDEVYRHRKDQSRDFNFVIDYDPNRRFRPAKPFVNRSLYYTLSDPETLLASFRDNTSDDYKDSPLPHLDAYRLTHAFSDWSQRNGALVFDSLFLAVEALFRPPPELDTQKSPRLRPSRKDAAPPHSSSARPTSGRYLSNMEAAHIIMICVHALTALVPVGWPHTWVQLRKLRGYGVVIPGESLRTTPTDIFAHPWLEIVDQLEYEPAVRLATRLLQGIGTRRCYEHVLASVRTRNESRGSTEPSGERETLLSVLLCHLTRVEKAALRRRERMPSTQNTTEDPGWTVTSTFMEWLRTIIVKQWDGNVEVNKWGSVGAATTIMAQLYDNMNSLNLRPDMFLIPYFNEEIDSIQAPLGFVKHKERPNLFHILQHHMFFRQETLVGYFRSVNFNRMYKQYQKSNRITQSQSRWENIMSDPRYWDAALYHLDVAIAEYLVLDVSRKKPLEETLNQLWGQEKRKLLKPLKIRIGVLEGEVGLDQGGVTYEFFRLILGEAFKPDNGMFTVDMQTGMTWFQPVSLEPLWKFEMFGVLFSLALYNGITLPVTFPLALYHYLLKPTCDAKEHTNSIDYIADGWPVLAKSFHEFLKYPGEVADVYMRDYTFSFEAFGQNIDVDMQAYRGCAWPDFYNLDGTLAYPDLNDPSWRRPRDVRTQPPTVTSADREQYIGDYIQWLTYKSVRPQLEAFTRGFLTCLHPASLAFFTPPTLRSLVEGSPAISMQLLRAHSVRYESPYHATHATILDFWAVVEQYGEDEKKRLLEFVTANERVPITGYECIRFEIVRAGGDTERLPTSSTCFGKLLLPEYEGKAKLEEKLGLAIRNSEGFGIV